MFFREEGNRKFRDREFTSAAVSYRRAILYLDYSFGETDADEAKLESERLKCHMNLAAVSIEREDYKDAINHCRLALQIDPKNCKALYRRGLASLRLGDLDEAQKDLYCALKMAPQGEKTTLKTIEASIRELNVLWRDYRRKTKSMASNSLGITG
jgi:tetratricopeptide (TPR) repeat protein